MSIDFQCNKIGLMKVFCLLFIFVCISCDVPQKIKYKGERGKLGKLHGKGIITYPNGETWEGEFKDGEPYTGKGVYFYPDSSNYKGEWIDGKRNNQGTLTLVDSNRYSGEWKDDKLNGQGIFTSVDGEQYTGEFKNDQLNGLGT